MDLNNDTDDRAEGSAVFRPEHSRPNEVTLSSERNGL